MMATIATSAAHRDPRGALRARLPGVALVLLIAVIPLEAVLVIPTQLRVPPYMLVLPLVLAIVAMSAPWRAVRFRQPIVYAAAAWVAVCAVSLLMWAIIPPPAVHLASEYGSLRTGPIRGPIQLAIILAFGAALPAAFVLCRRNLARGVSLVVGVGAIVAAYGIWQVYAQRFGLPGVDISNDPLTAGRSSPSWQGLLRSRSTFGEPAALGHYLLGPLALAGALAVWAPALRARLWAAAAASIIWADVVLTLSIGAWLGLVPMLLVGVAGLVAWRAWRRAAVVAAALVLATIIALAPLLATPSSAAAPDAPVAAGKGVDGAAAPDAPVAAGKGVDGAAAPDAPVVTDRGVVGGLSTVGDVLGDRVIDRVRGGFTEDRWDIIKEELRLFRDHPLLGVGLGAGTLYTAAKFSPGSLPGAQGVWWGSLAETGILGTAALLVLVGVFFWELLRGMRRTRSPFLVAVIVGAGAGVLGELVGYLTFYERIAPHVWVLMAVGLVAARAAREDRVVAP